MRACVGSPILQLCVSKSQLGFPTGVGYIPNLYFGLQGTESCQAILTSTQRKSWRALSDPYGNAVPFPSKRAILDSSNPFVVEFFERLRAHTGSFANTLTTDPPLMSEDW